MSKEMIIDRDKEILKLRGEIASLNDRCSWFLEEVDTPNGKAIVSKDLKKLKEAKELLKRCYDNYVYDKSLRGDIEKFITTYFPNENLEDVVK